MYLCNEFLQKNKIKIKVNFLYHAQMQLKLLITIIFKIYRLYYKIIPHRPPKYSTNMTHMTQCYILGLITHSRPILISVLTFLFILFMYT